MRINESNFGKGLVALRKARGQSQSAVARGSGLTQTYISRLENGVSTPSLEAVERIAATMGLPSAFLLFLGAPSPAADDPYGELIDATKAAIYSAVAERSAGQACEPHG